MNFADNFMNQDNRANVREIFVGIANKLLIDFDQIQAQISHDGERGEQREVALMQFLSKYLPKKYALGSGQVIDKEGNVSRQCDIVIYDNINCPLLLVEKEYQLFPIEAVLGVIEVKSILSSATLAEGVRNIQSVRKLQRLEPVAGFVFAFRSAYKKEPKIESLALSLRRVNRNVPSRERVDIVCVLSDGLIREYKGGPDWGALGTMLEVCYDATPSTLLLFLNWIIETLEDRRSSMPSLTYYASRGELGLFKLFSSADGDSD